MIPAQNIVAWGNVVPWADQRQVEQDLIISRALVEIFSDQMLRGALHDLAHALDVFEGLDADRIVEMFGRYLDLSGKTISRAQAQERMFAKLAQPRFLLDMRPLLPAARVEALTNGSTAESFRRVFTTLVDRLPGEPWGRTPAMKERFGISW